MLGAEQKCLKTMKDRTFHGSIFEKSSRLKVCNLFFETNPVVSEPPSCFQRILRVFGSQNFRGQTPLHRAAEKGHDVAVQRLLEAKALVDAKETTYGASNDQGNVLKHGILALKVDGMLMVQVLYSRDVICVYCDHGKYGKCTGRFR